MSGKHKLGIGVVLIAALLASMPLFAGKYNKVIDIGAPMPEFSNLPAADGKTYSSKDLEEDVNNYLLNNFLDVLLIILLFFFYSI